MSTSHGETDRRVEDLVDEESFVARLVSDDLDDDQSLEAVNLGDNKEQDEENNGRMHHNDDDDINANNEMLFRITISNGFKKCITFLHLFLIFILFYSVLRDDGESPLDFDAATMKKILQSSNINKDPKELLEEDIVGFQFNSIEEAETFYRIYSKAYGFSIRKNEVKKNKSGMVVVRSWCCSNAGFRQKKYNEAPNRVREQRSESRSGCKAIFRIGYTNSTKMWVVKKFHVLHNHSLANDYETVFLRSHRKISPAELEEVKLMKQSGMGTGQIWNLIVHMKGGWDKVGWTKKDLYNALAQDSRALDDVDATTTLRFLQSKESIDPDFFYAYKVDEDSRLTHLFWADGACRFDYELFGDSLAFDSTYKTNRSQMPLVVLVGTNNHAMTCVFGFAMIHNETAETYSWVLEKFQECMKGKLPVTVLTDGCRSMNKAIEDLMPSVVHRTCSWHILNNATKHVHREGFANKLSLLIKRYIAHLLLYFEVCCCYNITTLVTVHVF